MAEKEHSPLEAMRHSAAHLMAAAIQKLYPEAKFGIGPVVEDGFYYDVDLKENLTPADLEKIAKQMRELQKEDQTFVRTEVPVETAKQNAEKLEQPYKVELIEELAKAGEKKVSFYQTGDFIDLCAGPHVDKTSDIGTFKLLSVSTAYWKADPAKPQLQRIYGTAWATKEDLDWYLNRLEEAKKRDHRKLGVELDLFHFEEYSPAMPYWHPKGMIVYRELEKLARELEADGYLEIKTPEFVSPELYKKSGHIDFYSDNMFKALDDEKEYFVKPMNCPEAILVFKSRKRSYRDLPMRLANFDVLHRTEKSGVFHGLTRVREFSQDDAHIFCSMNQVGGEFNQLLQDTKKLHEIFKFKSIFKLATRPDKFMGQKSDWDRAETILKETLEKNEIGYELKGKDATFYGPKIDVYVEDALGRQWQLATLQLDFNQPLGLGAKFTDSDGEEKTPVMIHRALLGSIERFLGILLEHYGGSLPTWLSPVQVMVIPITEAQNDYGSNLGRKLKESLIRSEVDLRGEKLGAKIRDAQLRKIPYMLVVGEREVKAGGAAVRLRDGTDLKTKSVDEVLTMIKKEIDIRG